MAYAVKHWGGKNYILPWELEVEARLSLEESVDFFGYAGPKKKENIINVLKSFCRTKISQPDCQTF